jgi:hypothetical protein
MVRSTIPSLASQAAVLPFPPCVVARLAPGMPQRALPAARKSPATLQARQLVDVDLKVISSSVHIKLCGLFSVIHIKSNRIPFKHPHCMVPNKNMWKFPTKPPWFPCRCLSLEGIDPIHLDHLVSGMIFPSKNHAWLRGFTYIWDYLGPYDGDFFDCLKISGSWMGEHACIVGCNYMQWMEWKMTTWTWRWNGT